AKHLACPHADRDEGRGTEQRLESEAGYGQVAPEEVLRVDDTHDVVAFTPVDGHPREALFAQRGEQGRPRQVTRQRHHTHAWGHDRADRALMEGANAGEKLSSTGLECRLLPFLDPTVGDEAEHALPRETSLPGQPARDHHRRTLERTSEDRNR